MVIDTKLRERALDMAMEGRPQHEAIPQLFKDFPAATDSQVREAAGYAYYGIVPQSTPEPIVEGVESAEQAGITAYNKRRVRKAMIMLKVNYKSADADAVTDCIADLMHYCHAKGIDYTDAEETGRMHFNAELVGGEHG